MATPRKKNKIRDYDKTRQKMLEIIGEILRDTGYSGLKTNNIARRLGKDKNLIRYYFGSLANLEKTYIHENDYWFAFFEVFSLPENPGENDVKEFFIHLMQENFKFFNDTIEMQKIILWQISEQNALMRSVSDQREKEGEKLLQMTDRYFYGTSTSFRAVTALLLGGIYYLVLHAQTNKSTVCSIDINRQKDKELLAGTIRQVISWAFEQSGKEAALRPAPAQAADLSSRWERVYLHLKTMGIDAILLEIISLPSGRLKKEDDPTYMHKFTLAIENHLLKPAAGKDALLMLLIELNFNHSRFVAYCADYWKKQTAPLPNDTAAEKLIGTRKAIIAMPDVNYLPFEPRSKGIKERLISWIDEELRLLAGPATEIENGQQLQSRLNAIQLSYFAIEDRTQLEPIEKKLEAMLADVRKRMQ